MYTSRFAASALFVKVKETSEIGMNNSVASVLVIVKVRCTHGKLYRVSS